jgi:hypothetical protein
LYESVLRQIKDTNLAKDVKATAVSVIEHSPLPSSPVSPRPKKTILLGLLGGLAVGLTLVFGVDALDRSIKTVDQAESTLGLPVFAAVPDTTDEGPVSRLKRRSKAFRSSNYRVVVDLKVRRRKRSAICAPHFLSWVRKPSEKFRFSPVQCPAKAKVLQAPITPLHWPSRVIACS